jgi:hypothetical protein
MTYDSMSPTLADWNRYVNIRNPCDCAEKMITLDTSDVIYHLGDPELEISLNDRYTTNPTACKTRWMTRVSNMKMSDYFEDYLLVGSSADYSYNKLTIA